MANRRQRRAKRPATNQRTGRTYRIGGTAVTLLLILLYWWFTGGLPAIESPDAGPLVESTRELSAARTTSIADPTLVTPAATEPDPVTAAPANSPPNQDDFQETGDSTAGTESRSGATHTAAIASPRAGPPGMPVITSAELPAEALATLTLIASDGPFPFSKDGTVFQNRERLLPLKPRGYYREYTVITPGENDRGARRIVAGAEGEHYYTADHYASFFWINEP